MELRSTQSSSFATFPGGLHRCVGGLLLAGMLALAPGLRAAPGDLDPSFNGTGKVTTNVGSISAYANSVALQVDGKIVVAGYADIGSQDFALVRYYSNGTVDETFGSNGKVYTAIGTVEDRATAVVVQPDGKILAVGWSRVASGSNDNFALVRYTSTGALDTTGFGGGTGKVTTDFGTTQDSAAAVALQSDGKILVAGKTQTDFALARYNSDGTLDDTFSGDGKVTADFGSSSDRGHAVAVQADGKILVAGYHNNGSDDDFAVVRFNSDGTLDTSSFGTGGTGRVTTDFGSGDDNGFSMALQGDGKILVAGRARASNKDHFGLVRYTSSGALDTDFNFTGRVITPVGGVQDIGRSIRLQGDGKILVAGQAYNGSNDDFAVVRYTTAGALDDGFNGTGKVTVAIGAVSETCQALVVQPDNKILLAGQSYDGAEYDFALVRLQGDPSPELVLTGNGAIIADGDATPATADHTDFSTVQITGGAVTRTFTVQNTGNLTLTLSSVNISGAHAGDFMVSAQPASSVAPAASTSFQITFDPAAPGLRAATVSFTSNDGDESAFDFAIQGLGIGLPTFGQRVRPGHLSTGLRGWWKLEDATGGSRLDASGNNNHLTPVNAPTRHAENYWSTTEGSTQILDEGPSGDQELQISHAAQNGLEINGSSAVLTMAAWVRIAGHPTARRSIIHKHDASAHTGYGMCVTNAGNLWLNINDDSFYEAGNGSIALNRWHHVAVSFDGAADRAVYFVDGNVVGVRTDVTADIAPCADLFRIGGDDQTFHMLNGRIHDAAVWARVLSPLEIKSLASGIDVSMAYRPGNVSVPPTAWWKMNELGSGSAALLRQDSIGAVHWTDMNTATSGGGYLDGAAAEFRRANNEYLFIGDSSVFDFSGGVWSVSAWVMPYDLANRQLLFEQLGGGNDFMAAYVEANGSLVMRVDRSGATVVLVESAAGLVKPGTWHHCVFTEDGNVWKIYLDGREVTATGGSNADRATNYSGGIQIAQSGVLGGGAKFDGRLADFAVWRGHSLGSVEIKALATALPVQRSGITSYWPLDETTGTRNDAWGTNHLTPVNGPASAPGMVGSAASFLRSSAQRLEISHAAQTGLDAPSSISLLYWSRINSSGLQSVLGKWSANQGYMAFFTEANLPLMDVDATVWGQGNTAPANGAFHYGSQVFDGYQGNIYLNGGLDRAYAPTTTYAAVSNTAPFSIGSASGANYPFDGLIDEVVVARRWFRPEEIKALYIRGLNGLAAVPLPEITIEQPATVALVSGVSQAGFGSGLTGSSSQPKTFTIRNAGNSELTVQAVGISGANAADFVVSTTGTSATVAAGATTTFTVTFTPGAATLRTATLRISSNDEDESLFDILLTGTGVTAADVVQRYYLKAGAPDAGDIFGGDVAISGDTAVVGAPWEEGGTMGVNGNESILGAFRSGAAYVFVRDAAGQWTRQAYLKASNTQSYDYFGSSVAIHGDMIVVGAPGEDGGSGGVNGNQASEAFAQIGTSAGAAYVFVRQGTTWSQQAYLKAPVPVAQGNFGGSLAVNGDTVMVGASNQHAAFVFARSGAVWSQQQTLAGSNTEQGDYFGHAMALSGNTAAISAPWEDATGNSSFDCGAVYVFTRPAAGAAWTQQACLNASNPGQRDYFGKSLALDGDTLAVGAEEEDSNGTGVNSATQTDNTAIESGAVYVFTRAGSAWSQQAYVKAGNTGAGDLFGTSVALSGDSLLVGAVREDSSATWVNGNAANDNAADAGAAYLFKRVGTTWTQHAYLKASNTDAGDLFGNAVALSGDTALIGAEIEDGASAGINGDQTSNAQGDAGAAYLFTGLGPLAPEIRVEQPAGTPLSDSSSTVALGTVELGSGGTSVFTVRNVNGGELTGLAVSIAGANAGDFTVDTAGMSTTLAPGDGTTFTVTFAPTAIAMRTAVLRIASSDSDENPFDVTLAGTGTGTQSFTFASGADVAVTTNGFTATGNTINLSLGFAPPPFAVLTVLNNTSGSPIGGTFTNLAQGQTLTLTYGGTAYSFMADYFGGDGNDLVLRRRDPGVQDLSFNGVGRIATAFGSGHEQANDVVVQPDGKILAVGTAHDGSNDAFALARYTEDGALDPTFGTSGKVMTALGNQGSEAHAVALQPDGKIVAAGFTMNDGVRKIALVRYLANGTLDTAFGAGGKVTTLIGSINAEGRDVVLLADGRILVGGDYWAGADTDFALVRYNANGTLDTTFDTDGIVTTANAGKHDEATSVALAPDGKIVLGGYEQAGSNYLLKVARHTPAGMLDDTFGGDGLLTTEINVAGIGRDVTVQPDGRILLSGTAGGDAVVVRCNLDGTLDPSFGSGGIAGFAHGSFGDDVWSILLQPDGKILAGGLTEDGTAEDMLLLRLNSNGTLDTSFALTGKVAASFGLTRHDQAYGMALQPDGRIVLAGVTMPQGGNKDFALARFLVETTSEAAFTTASDVALNAHGLTATGRTLNITLGFAPSRGTELMLVNNTGVLPITGNFTNLAHGAIVPLTHNSVTYNFVASYSGGTGNDLTLLLPGPGGLDYSFNGRGKATTGFGQGDDYGRRSAVQADGKIVVAGYAYDGSNYDMALSRHTSGGALDASFGIGGKVTASFGNNNSFVGDMAVQADGKIVVAGYAWNGSNFDMAFLRYTAEGVLDSTFGTGGIVTADFGSGDDHAFAVLLQNDGRIVFAGYAQNGATIDFAVLRYTAGGTVDTSFGTLGRTTVSLGGNVDAAVAAALQPDGKIIVAGYSVNNGGNYDVGVIRLTSTGGLDSSFGSGGKVVTPVGSGEDRGRSVVLQADGKIIVAGYSHNGSNTDFAVVRYLENGQLDPSFGAGGKVTTAIGSGDERIMGAALQSDGKLLVAGHTSNSTVDLVLARYTTTGALDAGFGAGGKIVTTVGDGDDVSYGLMIQPDGKAIVTGSSSNGTDTDFAVLRYLGETTHDLAFTTASSVPLTAGSFSGDGQAVNIALGFAPSVGTELRLVNNTGVLPIAAEFTNLAHGATVPLTFNSVTYNFVASYTGGTGNDLTLLLPGPGALDYSFNGRGKVETVIGGSLDYGNFVVAQPDGKALVAGYCFNGVDNDFAIARYNADGSLDTSFGGTGKIVTAIGSGNDEALSIALQNDGRIVVAGHTMTGANRDFAVVRYLANGGLDPAFNSTGKVTLPIGSAEDLCNSVVVQPDGRIILGGFAFVAGNADFALVRLNTNGTLDTTFNATGIVTVPVSGSHDVIRTVALQPDGKIVVSGYATPGAQDFAVARFLSTGALDTTFNTTGKVMTSFGPGNDVGQNVVVLPDGGILVGGYASIGGNNDLALARYTSAGVLDAAFGSGGLVTTAVGGGHDVGSMAVQADGRIVMAGFGWNGSNFDLVVARHLPNGGLDTSFRGTGKAMFPVGDGDDLMQSLAFQPDGKILIAGGPQIGGVHRFGLVRLLNDTVHPVSFTSATSAPLNAEHFSLTGRTVSLTLGFAPSPGTELLLVNNTGYSPITGTFTNIAHGAVVPLTYNSVTYNFIANYTGGTGNDLTLQLPGPGGLDYSFNGSGKMTTLNGGHRTGYSTAFQSDGKIIVVGFTDNGTNTDFLVCRYTAAGALDATFGTGGRVVTPIGSSYDYARSVVVQPDGRILVGGYYDNGIHENFVLVRYTATGALDTSFGTDGKAVTGVGSGSDDRAYGMALQKDGKIILAGEVTTAGNRDFGLVRFLASGALDTSFGTGGKVTTAITSDFDSGQAVALQEDGKILVVGYGNATGDDADFLLARYTAAGALDTSFNGTGKVITNFSGSSADGGFSVLVQKDGKIVAGGSTDNAGSKDFALVRYNANGTVDTGFGTNGRVTTALDPGTDEINQLLLQADGKIVAAGVASPGYGRVVCLARYTTGGVLDATFGTGGKVTTAIGPGNVLGAAMRGDGKILVTGYVQESSTNRDIALLRYTGDTEHSVTFASATDVPLRFDGLEGAGRTLGIALAFAPTPGTRLKVYDNTGLQPAISEFANLPQGQLVTLTHNSVPHSFVASYFGGDGNDLVLEWAHTKLAAFGLNGSGQLGIAGTATQAAVPAQVVATEPIYSKTILGVSSGQSHSLAVCADGTVAAWGGNENGQLGHGGTSASSTPVAVTMSGPLSGKKAVAVAAGSQHSLVLFTDGTVAAWGDGSLGQLGDGGALDHDVPVPVNTSGALAGRRVVAISAGASHSAALCGDGTVVCWGDNTNGQLGDGGSTLSNVPVAVSTSGVLAGRSITAIACGQNHTLALLADGAVVAWGSNGSQQLGNNNGTTPSNVPVFVDVAGVLNGKRVLRLAAGGHSSLVQTTDGVLASWGLNDRGQLGVNSTTTFGTPQAVVMSGVLSGKTVTRLLAGQGHAAVVCSNGTLAAWGSGSGGQLGNNAVVDSRVPVAVNSAILGGADAFVSASSGALANHTLGVIATAANAPVITVEHEGAGLTHNAPVPVNFGNLVAGAYVTKSFGVRNTGTQALTNIGAQVTGADATLFAIVQAPSAVLAPGEATDVIITFNPDSIGARTARLQVASNGSPASFWVNLTGSGDPELNITWLTGKEVPAQANGFDANGKDASLNLGYAPVPGTRLMMVSNTGLGFIDGIFTNPFYGVLVHGQFIDLNFNGTDYTFVVNYYGGDGNDLVLEWAGNRLLSWGLNTGGALGNGSATPTHTTLPAPVNVTTPLNGKTVLSAACGFNHSLALCSDGTVAAWGTNASGQLGNNSTTASASPVAVNQSGALSGRQVVAVAAGTSFSVALCSDGAVVTWGLDTDGQLGNDAAFSNSLVPVLVNSSGALSGKVVTAIAAGGSHVLARCSDGTVVAWGSSAGLSGGGQLGSGSGNPFKSGVPVAVLAAGALSGKVVTHIAAGVTHSLASCRDGTLVAWGENPYGMLGNGTNTASSQPVLTNASGVLAGRHVMMLGAGIHHSIMLGTDGQLSGWGRNLNAQLGVNTATSFYYDPIVVPVTDAFAGRSIEQLVPGRLHHLVCLSDGSVAGWGSGVTGQLGNGATPAAAVVPVYVSTTALTAGERFTRIYSGSSSQHNIAIVARPLTLPGGPPVVSTSPASAVDKTSVTLHGLVNPNSLATDARFEYRLATGTYGPPTAAQALGSGSSSIAVTQSLTGLQPNTTYRYRIIAVNSGGFAEGSELTFATLPDPPSASVGAASNVGNEVATLNGIVNPNGRDTTASFQVALDPGFNTILNDYPVANITGTGGPVARSFTIEGGLFPGETYYYRISATNQAGSTDPETQNVVSFTTTTVGIATGPPLITSLTSTNVAAATARLQAFVNQQGSLFGDAWFEWGPVGGGYTSFTTQPFAVSGSTPQAVAEDIGSLSPATQYQYRIVARNNFNNQTIVHSAPQIFTTLPLPPEALTQSAVAQSTTSARLNATVNARNGSAAVSFEWGTDGVNFPNSLTATQSPVTGSTSTPVSVDIINLFQFTTYHYRVRAVSSGGTTVGEVRTFQPQIISGLLQQFPSAPPASNGSLTVTLAPSGLLSGWRFAGEHRWRASGDTAAGLVHGSRVLEFRPVPGYLQPGSVPVTISSTGQTEDFEYHVTPSQGTGGILVVLKPDSLAQATLESARGQWRLLGETVWRDSLANAPGLPVGKYLVECKPVTGYATPSLVNVTVTSGATVNVTIVYSDAFSPTGTPPSVVDFTTVSTDATKPYGYVGQIRSNSGVGTGFAVKSRVVATAAHVVFDEATHSSVQGLQWLPQADAGTHDPLPVTPRGYYLISGYSTLRGMETPGSFSLASRQQDVAALYFINTTAVRNGFSGFLASDLTNNEFLLSGAQKMLVGYPVDDVVTLAQGRMHATPAANLSFTGLTDCVFATSGIRSTGGNSGGPLCVQHTNGSWYPAAIYLGGATQSIVRAIDSTVIQLFDTAQQSAADDQGYGGGGITHTGYSAVSAATTGSLIVNITPGGTGWRPTGSTKPVTPSGNIRADMTEGTYTIEFTPVAGYQTPANQSVQVIAGTTQTYSIEYLPNQTPQESWRQTHFGSSANSGNGADSADPDGDGYSNLAEYTAGTHPTNASDHFKAQSPTRGAGTFSLSTAGKTGRTYELQRSSTLTSASWTPVLSQGPLTADATVTLTDAASPAGSAFYRIQVVGPPP